MMKPKSVVFKEQQRLVADFFVNVAVAWFAAGVIGVFINRTNTIESVIYSISWGSLLSMLFLFGALYIIRK